MQILLLCLLALLGSTAAANALPIFGAIAGFLGLTGVAATAVSIGLSLAAGVGLSLLSNALFAPKAPEQVGGTSGKLQVGGVVPRAFPLGRALVTHSLVYGNTFGTAGKTPNAYQVFVFALADLPVTGLAEIWVDGAKVTWNAAAVPATEGIAIPEYRDDGKDHLWVRFHDGTQTAADARLVALFATDAARPYGASRVGRGVAYAVVTMRTNDSLFSGFPQFKFVLDGIPLYDPRRDSSVGGTGAQRWTDPSTWSAAENPIVAIYNVLRGIRFDGTWFFGGQTVSQFQVPFPAWSAAANACDFDIDEEGGVAEYRCGGEVRLDMEPAAVIEDLLAACNGRLGEIGGIYKPHAGAPDSAVFAIADADILSTEAQTFEPFPGLAETVNGVTAKYIEPAEGWAAKDAPPRYDAGLEAADGGRRQIADLSYDLVPFGRQVQRLMAAALKEERRFRRHALPLPPDAFPVEPNDFIVWTSARNGYTAKLFRVDAVQDLANLNVGWSLKEVDPGDHDPIATATPVSGPTVIVRPPPQPILEWTAAGVIVTGDEGRTPRPAIRLAWDPDVDDVDGVHYEIRVKASGALILQSETDRYDAGAIVVSQNVASATDYEARGRYRAASPRATSWSGWLTVTTPDVPDAGLSLQERYELSLVTANAQGSLSAWVDEFRGRLAQLAADAAATAGQGYEQRQEIRRSVSAVVDGQIGAAIEELLLAVANEAEARSQADLSLAAQYGGFSASGQIRFQAVATSADALASYSVLVNVAGPSGSDFRSAGLLIDVLAGGASRIVLLSDQTIIYDGVTGVLFQNGKLTGLGGLLEIDLRQGRIIGYREV